MAYNPKINYSIFFILLIANCFAIKTYGQIGFPYCETFDGGSTQSSTVFGGSAVLNSGVLRLTSNQNDQSGFVYIDMPFSSTFGIKASFEYFCYGGTGADGLTAFLFDAAIANFSPGGFGGSLGYARRDSEAGLSGAYLGIGFDTFGNFGNNTQGKIGGFPGNEGGFHPNSIVVRGPGQGISGYQYIVGKKVNEGGIFGLPETQRFSLSSGGQGTNRIVNPQIPGYRQVFLNLEPNPNDVGYLLTVEMLVTTEAGNPRSVTIFNQEPYPFEAPEELKIGFAASTGGENNFHEIRNVIVEVSNQEGLTNPEGVDIDDIASCAGQENTFDLFNSNIILPNENSNLRCVQFYETIEEIQAEEEDVCSQGSCRAENRELILAEGVFRSDQSGGGFTFFPNPEFVNEYVEVFYTITDSYGKRSLGNKLRLLVQESPSPVRIESENFSPSQDEIRLCEGQTVNFKALGDETYNRFEWFFNNELIADDLGGSIEASTPGEYKVLAFNGKNCPAESNIVSIVNPDLPELEIDSPVVGCLPGEGVDLRIFITDYNEDLFDYEIKSQEGVQLTNEELSQVSNSGEYLFRFKHKDLTCWSEEIVFQVIIVDEPVVSSFDYEVDGTGIKTDEQGGIFIDDPIRFTSESTGGAVSWFWDFGDGSTSIEETPIHVFGQKGDFEVALTIMNELGCEDTFIKELSLTQSFRVMYPTGFTPTQTENQFFKPKFKGIITMELSIFNLWGNLVFQTSDVNSEGWDGQVNGELMPGGSYVYKVKMESIDGDLIEESGRFLLIR
ncbi:PKD domain-containing protein [Belliella sp. DSM 107340]|uniref:PKD domain-containing protein n=1 Tax=Belliella calami TaxID=2923436 RepID=A0ABS9UST9_9BACT|nr:PKD domain-containing protein [Belliella calami]MCH7399687.1 PKD domain-containing protein [Belliella calami]